MVQKEKPDCHTLLLLQMELFYRHQKDLQQNNFQRMKEITYTPKKSRRLEQQDETKISEDLEKFTFYQFPASFAERRTDSARSNLSR